MTVSPSDSVVTITILLDGQEEVITGLQAVSDAATETASAVSGANTDMATTAATSAETQTGAYADTGDAATAALAKIVESAETAGASLGTLADETDAASSSIIASYERMAAASTTAAAKQDATNTSLLGTLGSLKTLATGAAAYAAIKSVSDYQSALERLATMAGLSQKAIRGVRTELSAMSTSTGQTPTALANAMYSPVSEGFSAKSSEVVARYAAELSNMSGAPISGTGSTSYAISTMLRAEGMAPTARNIQSIAALIRGSVSTGDMTLSDFLSAETTGIFDTAKTYGISAKETSGMLDYMTSQGVPAQQAGTRMRMTLALLTGNSTSAATFAQALGLSDYTVNNASAASREVDELGLSPTKMAEVISGPNGVVRAYNMINKAMQSGGFTKPQQDALWSKLFGGGRSDTTAMQLAQGASSGLLQKFIDRTDAASTGSSLTRANREYDQTTAFKFRQLESDFERLAITVGHDLIPGFDALVTVLKPFLQLAALPGVSDMIAGLLGYEVLSKTGGMLLNTSLGSKLEGKFLGGLSPFSSAETTDLETDAATGLDRLIAAANGAAGALEGLGAKSGLAGDETVAGGGALGAEGALGAGALGAETEGAVGAVGISGMVGTIIPIAIPAAFAYLIARGYLSKDVASFQKKYVPGGTHQHDLSGAPGIAQSVVGLWNWLNSENLDKKLHLNDLDPTHWFAAGGALNAGRTGGFKTAGPVSIVGEGNPRYPEFVIPTDPGYRSRAMGLLGALTPHLMANGGIVGAGVAGSGTDMVATLAQLASGNPSGVLRSLLTSMSASEMGQLLSSQKSIDATIGTSVPGGMFRSFLIGLTNTIFSDTTRAIGGGAPPTGASTPTGAGAVSARSLASVAGLGGSPTQNKTLGQRLAALYGWTGAMWNDLDQLVMDESGWSATAQNPTSTAYGIAQNINGPAGYGSYGNTPRGQIEWMLAYIKQRYGTPAKALAHENAVGWYASGGILGQRLAELNTMPVLKFDEGGMLPTGATITLNETGSPEPVLSGLGDIAANQQPQIIQLVVGRKVLAEVTTSGRRAANARS